MILALDTTAEYGSIALVDRDRVIGEVLLHSPRGIILEPLTSSSATMARLNGATMVSELEKCRRLQNSSFQRVQG